VNPRSLRRVAVGAIGQGKEWKKGPFGNVIAKHVASRELLEVLSEYFEVAS
jgi:hypothetical protein